MEFEWDEAKAASNIVKHDVAFEDVLDVFLDMRAEAYLDRSMNYGEDRFATVGMGNGILYYVVYTERDDTIRIITARKATRREQREYDRNR